MANVSYASTFVVTDRLGVDPLLDPSYEAVKGVRSYTLHKITTREEFKSKLLAYELLGNERFERYLLMYNDMIDPFELKAGLRIKVPNASELVTALTDVTLANSTVNTVAI